MQIGNVTINGKLALAPMAGVTDLAFRHICREHGAALTVTEMVSAKALRYKAASARTGGGRASGGCPDLRARAGHDGRRRETGAGEIRL